MPYNEKQIDFPEKKRRLFVMIMLELLPNDSCGRQRNFAPSPISSIV